MFGLCEMEPVCKGRVGGGGGWVSWEGGWGRRMAVKGGWVGEEAGFRGEKYISRIKYDIHH